MVLDLAMAYSGDETRDGGQTPGPFEEMSRRMTSLAAETPALSPRQGGIWKQKRMEKKRKWVWTVGKDDEADTPTDGLVTPKAVTTITAHIVGRVTKSATPEPITAIKISVEQPDSESESDLMTGTDGNRMDLEMSETNSLRSSRATTPYSVDLDIKTPTVHTATSKEIPSGWSPAKRLRLALADLTDHETGRRGDTPIPPDLVTSGEDANRQR
jgi:hypothetical protein